MDNKIAFLSPEILCFCPFHGSSSMSHFFPQNGLEGQTRLQKELLVQLSAQTTPDFSHQISTVLSLSNKQHFSLPVPDKQAFLLTSLRLKKLFFPPSLF